MLYYHVKDLNAKLIGLWSPEYDCQLWHLCRVRKPHRCRRCTETIIKGSWAWRPITNKANRWHRLCWACADRIPHKEGLC